MRKQHGRIQLLSPTKFLIITSILTKPQKQIGFQYPVGTHLLLFQYWPLLFLFQIFYRNAKPPPLSPTFHPVLSGLPWSGRSKCWAFVHEACSIWRGQSETRSALHWAPLLQGTSLSHTPDLETIKIPLVSICLEFKSLCDHCRSPFLTKVKSLEISNTFELAEGGWGEKG